MAIMPLHEVSAKEREMLHDVLITAIVTGGIVGLGLIFYRGAMRYLMTRLERTTPSRLAIDEAKTEKTRERRLANDVDEATADEQVALEKARLRREAAEQDALTAAAGETKQDLIDGRRQQIQALTAARIAQAPETARLEAEAGVNGQDTSVLVPAYQTYVEYAFRQGGRYIKTWPEWLGDEQES
jgi:hypothetical protein